MSQLRTKFITDHAITNVKLAQMPTLTLKGNNTGLTGDALDLTVAQVNTMLGTITSLTGDVTGTGPGATATTIAKIQGTTVSGTTGTGNVVFSASPTFTGTIVAAAANLSGALSASNFSGSSSGTNTGDQTITLTGEATGSGTGSFAVTLSNAAVIAKVLTGYTSGAGTVSAADSILSAIQKLNGNDALKLPLAGGTMSGNIAMGGNKLTGLGAGTGAGDSVRYEQAILASGVNPWTANQSLGGFVITNSGAPVNPGDLVTKSYVDNFINATSWKAPVLVATTANITLSGEQTIDGVLTSASRVLVKSQTAPENNGIYVSAAGAWSRAADMDSWSEVPAAAVFVEEGTLNGDIGFVCTSDPGGTLGTDAITWVQFSSAGAYSADNVTLQLISGVFSVKNGGISNTQVNAAAAIAYSKLNLSGSIVNTDIATGAAIAFSKLAALTSAHILVGNGSNVATDVAVSGDLTLANTGAFSLVATSNATLTTLSALTTATNLASVGTITTGTWNATTIAINHGGTGQTTALAAFNALSPLTTTGDLLYYTGGNNARLGIGSTGFVLTVVGGVPAWAATASTQTPTEEHPTLSGTDITNQYFDLGHVALGSSATVNSISLSVVGGLEQLKGVDYTISLTGGSGGVTRITFAGDLATGGAAALVATDILMIKYTY